MIMFATCMIIAAFGIYVIWVDVQQQKKSKSHK